MPCSSSVSDRWMWHAVTSRRWLLQNQNILLSGNYYHHYYYYRCCCTVCKCLWCKIDFVFISLVSENHVTAELVENKSLLWFVHGESVSWLWFVHGESVSLLWLVHGESVSWLWLVIYFLMFTFCISFKSELEARLFPKDGINWIFQI